MPKPNDKPSPAHVGQMRSWLARNGISPAIANTIVKTSRTMGEISNDLRAWIKTNEKENK